MHNKALLRTSHKVRRPENADVRENAMKKQLPIFITLIVLVCGSGCASVINRTFLYSDYQGKVYPGVRTDLKCICRPFDHTRHNKDAGQYLLAPLIGILDMPFSFVFDTLLLPVDVFFPPDVVE